MNALTQSEASARRVLARIGLSPESVKQAAAKIPKVAPLNDSALNRAAGVQKEPAGRQDWRTDPALIEACQRVKKRLEKHRSQSHGSLIKIARIAGFNKNVAGNLLSGMVRVMKWEKVHRLNYAMDRIESAKGGAL